MDMERIKQGVVNIAGPSPIDSARKVQFEIDDRAIEYYCKDGKLSSIFQVFYNVAGVPIPVNSFGFHEQHESEEFPDHFGGIRHTVAVFQGVKRPLDDVGFDRNIFVYVTDHRYSYEYIPHMVCIAKRREMPKDSVFVIYVYFENEADDVGQIRDWEWVKAGDSNPPLPENCGIRYEREKWICKS